MYSRYAREIPSTSLRAGSSLRLKNGYAQDDADMDGAFRDIGFTRAQLWRVAIRGGDTIR